MNFDLLADLDSAAEIAAALPPHYIATVLRHVVCALRFSAEIRDGCWVFNGDVMREQEDKYQRQFRHLDVSALQLCIALIGQHRIASASIASTSCANPVEQLWCAVFDGAIGQIGGTALPASFVTTDATTDHTSNEPELPVLARWL